MSSFFLCPKCELFTLPDSPDAPCPKCDKLKGPITVNGKPISHKDFQAMRNISCPLCEQEELNGN